MWDCWILCRDIQPQNKLVIKKTYFLEHELCYSTSKSINDEKDKFKSFMAIKIATHIHIFKLIIGSQYHSLSQKKKKKTIKAKLQNTKYFIFHFLNTF